jgi:hypothetical protein
MSWIKLEHATPDKPEVWEMAEILGIDPDAVLGKVLRAWIWADQNCNASGVTSVTVLPLLDRITSVTGFADAMVKVGWIVIDGNGCTFPNFDRHNGKPAKTRALTAKRAAEYRVKSTAKSNGASVTGVTLPALPDKIRLDKSTKPKTKPKEAVILPFPSLEFSEAWKRWESHRKEKRKPITPTSRDQQLKKLGQMSERAAIEMIDYTIFKGWEGLREPEESKPRRGTIEANNPEPVNYGTPGFTPARYP